VFCESELCNFEQSGNLMRVVHRNKICGRFNNVVDGNLGSPLVDFSGRSLCAVEWTILVFDDLRAQLMSVL